ncbi:MAG TPA: nitric-oxide reductase large subunit, partial [Pseudobdellovibrionaceae bacterium]|nr:nitric-oxide reductase large subunit [Pseudobdellovibrionaceae bacterium]
MKYRNLWAAFTLVFCLSFAVLGYYGFEIYQKAPPYPRSVVTETGDVLFTESEIKNGLNVWQSIGGQQLGSVWGHGAYVAPDWTADWIHREALALADRYAQAEHGISYAELDIEKKAALQARLQAELKKNSYDPSTGDISVSADRAEAIRSVSAHYDGLFMNDPALADLRDAYAMPAHTIKSQDRMKMLNAFFFWTAWAGVTLRPGEKITYTNNWPPDQLVGNVPTGALLIWTGFSVILLLIGIGMLASYYAANREDDHHLESIPENDPLVGLNPTPSMLATLKYFWVVCALMVVQVILGAVTAHYGVEGNGFYGFPLADYFPYSVTRTWHVQMGIFWIATSWLATGLFIGPA